MHSNRVFGSIFALRAAPTCRAARRPHPAERARDFDHVRARPPECVRAIDAHRRRASDAQCGVITALLVIGLTLTAGIAAERIPRETASANERFILRIEPGKGRSAERACRGTLLDTRGGEEREVWARPLVNDRAPEQVFIRDDGRLVVTLDEHRRGGARNALVIYGAKGELLRHFVLSDLLTRDDWRHVRNRSKSIEWLTDAECEFVARPPQFVIDLAWGRKVRVDLRTLRVLKEPRKGQDAGEMDHDFDDELPPEIAAALGLDPVGEDSPSSDDTGGDEGADSSEDAMNLGEPTEDGALEGAGTTLAEAIAAAEAAGNTALLNVLRQIEELGTLPADMRLEPEQWEEIIDTDLTFLDPMMQPLVEVLGTEPPPVAADAAAAAGLREPHELPAGAPPTPDPAAPVDYLDWINQQSPPMGDKEDAASLYSAAIASFQNVTDAPVQEALDAALTGDSAALASPALREWLASNRASLDTFREASRHLSKSWSMQSDSGELFGVLLNDLAPTRQISKALVIEGNIAAQEGRYVDAAETYLDVIAAGGHNKSAPTMIENLVGMAIQPLSQERLIELLNDPNAGELNYEAIASRLELAAPSADSLIRAVQFEQAAFMDSVQRMFKPDPAGGAPVLDPVEANRLLSLIDDATAAEKVAALGAAGFKEAVGQGTMFYSEAASAMARPYSEAQRELSAAENWISSAENKNSLLTSLGPSFRRYHQLQTRSEADRRGTIVVARLREFERKNGRLPDSLTELDLGDSTYDPFTSAPFVYRRTETGYLLYSPSHDGLDDGGQHDRRLDTGDHVIWPRPKPVPNR